MRCGRRRDWQVDAAGPTQETVSSPCNGGRCIVWCAMHTVQSGTRKLRWHGAEHTGRRLAVRCTLCHFAPLLIAGPWYRRGMWQRPNHGQDVSDGRTRWHRWRWVTTPCAIPNDACEGQAYVHTVCSQRQARDEKEHQRQQSRQRYWVTGTLSRA